MGSNFILLRVDSFSQGDKNNLDKVVAPDSVYSP